MRRLRRLRFAGFSLVEGVLVVAIIGIASALLIPALGKTIRVAKMRGVTTNNESILRRCRYEAIKRGVPCQVNIVTADGELFAFADVHGGDPTLPPDGLFNPITTQPVGATDYEVRRQEMPVGITLEPSDGFTGDRIVFEPDGSVREAGAVRVTDTYGNQLEIRITTASASRIEVLKFQDGAYRSQGEGPTGEAWRWE